MIPALIVGIVLTGAGQAQAQTENKQQFIVSLSEPGKPCKVRVGALNGSIKVTGYDGKEIIVEVEAEKRNESSSSSGGMRRIGGGGAEVTAREDDNNVVIDAGLSHITLVSVKVPMNTSNLHVSTVNDGNITVSNVNGQVEIDNVNGWIRAEGVSGSVVANTVNGDVVVSLKSVNPQSAMAFSTLNGKVDVTFPADLKAKVKLKAEQGDVFSDFDVLVDKGHTDVEKSSGGHMYKINIDDWVYGTINGGGPEIMMKTTNGSVYVKKAK